jgi:DNA-binding XRE family transcriptional regulator
MTMAQVIDPKRLQQLRKLRGLTQDELAKKARLNKQTV